MKRGSKQSLLNTPAHPQNKLNVICQINICQNIECKKILINPRIDVVNINAYAKFGQNPSSSSQDIERKFWHQLRVISLLWVMLLMHKDISHMPIIELENDSESISKLLILWQVGIDRLVALVKNANYLENSLIKLGLIIRIKSYPQSMS